MRTLINTISVFPICTQYGGVVTDTVCDYLNEVLKTNLKTNTGITFPSVLPFLIDMKETTVSQTEQTLIDVFNQHVKDAIELIKKEKELTALLAFINNDKNNVVDIQTAYDHCLFTVTLKYPSVSSIKESPL